jgi:hypothetical protein
MSTKKQQPLTPYEKQMRAAIREACRIFDDNSEAYGCSDCGEGDHDGSKVTHDETCLVVMLRRSLRRPS